ncbi:MAG: hypothetical protein AAFV95_01950 [Bacteroidota bacterium]
MKFIHFLAVALFLASAFPLAVHAQTTEAMNAAAQQIQKASKAKGYRLSEHMIFESHEFNMGLSTILYPGNEYWIIISDDGHRDAPLQLEGSMMYDSRLQLEELQKELSSLAIGIPEDFKTVQAPGLVYQKVDMRTAFLAVDYSIDFEMAKEHIKADSKVNVLIYYKSDGYIKGIEKDNREERGYQSHLLSVIEEKRASLKAANSVSAEELLLNEFKDAVIRDVGKYGYSLASYQALEIKEFPKELPTVIHGGNQYLLVLFSMDATRLQITGTPDANYNKLAKVTDGMTELPAFEAESMARESTHQIDLRTSLYAAIYTLKLLGTGKASTDKPMAGFFVFYKSYENVGGADNNKAEDYYTQQVKEKLDESIKALGEAAAKGKEELEKEKQ